MANQKLSSQSAIVSSEEDDPEAFDELIASKILVPDLHASQRDCIPAALPSQTQGHCPGLSAQIQDHLAKALVFSVVNRSCFGISSMPVLTWNPHDLVPFFEFQLYGSNPRPNLDGLAESRLFATHIPYPSLPECVKRSDCRIIYIYWNPLDTVVSSWLFFLEMARLEEHPEWSLEEHFKTYCHGKISFGPFSDHMIGYWKESLERPHKVLFLKYEDLKEDIMGQLKKVADFVGLPFTEEEERGGVIVEIAKMCSLKNLKGLEANKNGKFISTFNNISFFRKGEVGDWVN